MQGDGGHRNEVLTLSWQPISVGGNDDDGNDGDGDGDSLLLSGGCGGGMGGCLLMPRFS